MPQTNMASSTRETGGGGWGREEDKFLNSWDRQKDVLLRL